jgi:hypothetical protein
LICFRITRIWSAISSTQSSVDTIPNSTFVTSEFRGHHTEFHICDVARRDKFELGSNIALVEAVDQATDHPGDDFEPLLESKRCGVFDEGAAPRDLQ